MHVTLVNNLLPLGSEIQFSEITKIKIRNSKNKLYVEKSEIVIGSLFKAEVGGSINAVREPINAVGQGGEKYYLGSPFESQPSLGRGFNTRKKMNSINCKHNNLITDSSKSRAESSLRGYQVKFKRSLSSDRIQQT